MNWKSTRNSPLVKASITPAFSRYFLNSSRFESATFTNRKKKSTSKKHFNHTKRGSTAKNFALHTLYCEVIFLRLKGLKEFRKFVKSK